MKESFVSHCEGDTESLAMGFAKKLKSGDLVCFFGDLGAGKTAFVRAAVSVLCPDALVCSPTYAIMNEYISPKFKVSHFDLYRIQSEDDLYSIGFDDYFDDERIIFTEWSENVKEFLPRPRYEITVTKTGESERLFEIEYLE